MIYIDPERLDPDTVELRRQWRATGLMQDQIAQQIGVTQATVSNVLLGRSRGKTKRRIEELFASMQNVGGSKIENGSKPDLPKGNGVPILVEAHSAARILETPGCSAERILETIKLLVEGAENVCSLRKLLREAELHYNALVRKAVTVGIRIEEHV